MNFNLRTFRLYGGDLWGTLLLSPTLTRTLKYLILLRRSSKRFSSRRSTVINRNRLLASTSRTVSPMSIISSKLLELNPMRLIKSKPPVVNCDTSSGASTLPRARVYYQLRRLLPYRFFAPLVAIQPKRYNSKKDGSRYVVDFLKTSPFDKLFINPRRRTFLGRLAMNYRKFQKFYANTSRAQFMCLAYESRLQPSDNLHFFISRLERRLDMVLFRTGLATSLFMSKHLISYCHVSVNDCLVSLPSYRVELYDKVYLLVEAYKIVKAQFWFRFTSSLFFNRLRSKEQVSRLPVVHFFSSTHYVIDYHSLASILIAEVSFKSLYYPFKIDASNIELYLYRAKKRIRV